jgi:hypothetical protein
LEIGQKILEIEMENVRSSQSCFGKISEMKTAAVWLEKCPISEMKTAVIKLKRLANGNVEFERVSKTQNFCNNWFWLLLELGQFLKTFHRKSFLKM